MFALPTPWAPAEPEFHPLHRALQRRLHPCCCIFRCKSQRRPQRPFQPRLGRGRTMVRNRKAISPIIALSNFDIALPFLPSARHCWALKPWQLSDCRFSSRLPPKNLKPACLHVGTQVLTPRYSPARQELRPLCGVWRPTRVDRPQRWLDADVRFGGRPSPKPPFCFREEFRAPLGVRKPSRNEPRAADDGLWAFRFPAEFGEATTERWATPVTAGARRSSRQLQLPDLMI